MAKSQKKQKQLNFWIKEDKLTEIDKFIEENNFHTRTKFLLESLDVVFTSPDLLDEDYLKKLQSDRELLFELVKLFDQIPCEFEFNSRPHEDKRLDEIIKELGLNA